MKYILDNPPLLFEIVVSLLLIILLGWKLIHFIYFNPGSADIFKSIYFSNYSIVNSSNEDSRQFKVTQNKISTLIFLLLVPEIFLLLLNHVWLAG